MTAKEQKRPEVHASSGHELSGKYSISRAASSIRRHGHFL